MTEKRKTHSKVVDVLFTGIPAGIVNLNEEETNKGLRQDESIFGHLVNNNRFEANRLFPYGESRFHHCSVTAGSVQIYPNAEV